MAFNQTNPVDISVRNDAKRRLTEILRQTGMTHDVNTVEQRIFQQTKTRDEYVNFFQKFMHKIKFTAMQKANAANILDQQKQQNVIMQQQPTQMAGNQAAAAPQQASAGTMISQVQSNLHQMQNTNSALSQPSPGQGMQMRPMQMKHSANPVPRNTAPSPQSNVGGYQPRSQWSQPSPVNQFGQTGHFAQPRPPVPSNSQPVLTMPESTGTPHPSAIPNLSPAHPSPQIGTSSPSLRTPGSVQTAPSPSAGQLSMATVPSPAPASQVPGDEDKEYMEKLKQLQKYIEPLSRMIDKFNEGEEPYNKEISKMKNLRDTLINPSKRLPISTLEKCEKVLQSWLDQKPSQTQILAPEPGQHMCQPILNVIATATKSPLLNHTLKRTFGPAMRTICGDYATPKYLPSKRQCIQAAVREMELQHAKEPIPRIIRGEIARLNSKFNIKLDKSYHDNNGSIRILCFLDDSRLPCVPPLQLFVPRSYPEECPEWVKTPVFSAPVDSLSSEDANHSNGSTQSSFEKRLLPILENRMTSLNQSTCTISSMVRAWEISIQQACSIGA